MTDFIERLKGVVEVDYLSRLVYVLLRDRETGEVYTFKYSAHGLDTRATAWWQRGLVEKAKWELALMWKRQPDV